MTRTSRRWGSKTFKIETIFIKNKKFQNYKFQTYQNNCIGQAQCSNVIEKQIGCDEQFVRVECIPAKAG